MNGWSEVDQASHSVAARITAFSNTSSASTPGMDGVLDSYWRPGLFALAWFVLGAYSLDLQFPSVGVNVGNLLLLGGSLASAALAVYGRVLHESPGVPLKLHDFIYLAYLLFVLASAGWSPSPANTIAQFIYLSAVWLGAICLASARLSTVVSLLVWLAVLTAILSFLIVPVSQEVAFQPASSTALPELRGVFSHQLRLGLFMSMALGCLGVSVLNGDLQRLAGSRVAAGALIGVLGICLVAAFARLYTAAMLLAFAAAIGLSAPRWRYAFLIFTGIFVALCWAYWEPLIQWVASTDTDLTLTGRTLMWVKTLAATGSSHWLGFGFASFDHPSFDWIWGYYRPAHPHNSYLQAYFETGYIGLALTVLLVGSHLRAAIGTATAANRYSYSLYLVLLMAIGSLTGSNYAGKPTLLFAITYLVLSVETRIKWHNAKARRIGN
jgi:exopolysaccharide production protein ExoQ